MNCPHCHLSLEGFSTTNQNAHINSPHDTECSICGAMRKTPNGYRWDVRAHYRDIHGVERPSREWIAVSPLEARAEKRRHLYGMEERERIRIEAREIMAGYSYE